MTRLLRPPLPPAPLRLPTKPPRRLPAGTNLVAVSPPPGPPTAPPSKPGRNRPPRGAPAGGPNPPAGLLGAPARAPAGQRGTATDVPRSRDLRITASICPGPAFELRRKCLKAISTSGLNALVRSPKCPVFNGCRSRVRPLPPGVAPTHTSGPPGDRHPAVSHCPARYSVLSSAIARLDSRRPAFNGIPSHFQWLLAPHEPPAANRLRG